MGPEVARVVLGAHQKPWAHAVPPVEQRGEVVVDERVGVVHQHVPAVDPRAQPAERSRGTEPLVLLDRHVHAARDVVAQHRLRAVRR